jgi:predicted ATPase
MPSGTNRGVPVRNGTGVRRIASALHTVAGGPYATAGPAARCTANRVRDGLAVLNLLSDAAEPQPLICVVDDEQWLDRASAQVLGFVARRLVAESVGMVFAARVPSTDIAGLSDLTVEGLPEADARALLDSALTGPLDSKVRDRILAGTNGNPLALLELPRALSSTT